MGLDIIELIVSFEKYFNIVIPDKEAEKLNTLGEVTRYICQSLYITAQYDRVYNTFYAFVREQLISNDIIPAYFHSEDALHPYIDLSDKLVVQSLSKIIELPVEQYKPYNFPFWHKMFTQDSGSISLAHFIECTAIYNYGELYESQHFISEQQVYLAVAMLTLDKAGVDIYELGRDKSFTNDLGMD